MTQRENRKTTARDRIKWVRSILGPGCNKDRVETAVGAMMGYQARHEHFRSMNKPEKNAIARTAAALRRLNATLANPELPTTVGKLLPMPLAELHTIQKELEQLGHAKLRRPRRPTTHMKRRAAQLAGWLLQAHRLPLKTTRGSKYHRVAAAIYGDKDADLFNHLRAFYDHQLFEEFYDEE
jgi:hypothetical protein